MHSIRRAATRATLTSSVSAAAVGSKSQSISSALRALNAAAVSARYFSVAAPRAFSRSVAFRDEQQSQPEEDAQAQPKREVPNETVLFVQNYPFDVTPDEMKEAFSKYGEVVGISMPAKKTFCFVYYKDAQSVITAAENVDGTFWHGRRIVAKFRPASHKKFKSHGGERENGHRSEPYSGPPTATLYIGNIAFESTDVDLNSVFATLEGIKDVRVAVDRATGWPRGFAHADFVNVDAATAALEALQGTQIRNRELRVSFAPGSKKESDRLNRMSQKKGQSRNKNNSQAEVEQRVEEEHEQAEEAQKEQKPVADKQDMNWNA
ncbi:RNA-binding domain-containing protein [Colletotrichum sublineola]|nr:RNA-binding domain-containing protein [Colletotrichum sublineola]